MVWLITESDLTFVDTKHEWTGTKVIFDIFEKDGKTHLQFTHDGFSPDFDCYESCAPAWDLYLRNKLEPLMNSGQE